MGDRDTDRILVLVDGTGKTPGSFHTIMEGLDAAHVIELVKKARRGGDLELSAVPGLDPETLKRLLKPLDLAPEPDTEKLRKMLASIKVGLEPPPEPPEPPKPRRSKRERRGSWRK